MVWYFKRMVGEEIVGLGYADMDNKDLMIEMFKNQMDFVQIGITNEEFKELATTHGFCGLIPCYGEIPKGNE